MDSAVISFLKSKKLSVIEENISSKLMKWDQWYRGNVDKFHKYRIYTGKKSKQKTRKSLNMASRVCQDWADLLLNEKVEIICSDEETQEVVDRLLEQTNFYVRGNNLLERAFALGGGFFIQYWDGTKTNQKYISQDYMYPITCENGILKEAAFASEKMLGGKKYTYIETHLLTVDGYYTVDNFLCEKVKNKLTEVNEEVYKRYNLTQKIETHSKKPLFQQIKPNVANKDDFDSPYGTSVFSGATDCLKAADTIFDSYYSEFELGRKRLFVKDGVTTVNYNSKGEKVVVFDPNDEVFYSLPDNGEGDEAVKEVNMELRVDAFDKGLQTQLNLISQNCGFGANGYKWESGNVATATQIISENSKMFRTLRKHEILLEEALINMVKGLLYVEKEYAKESKIKEDISISINFDDSIIEDTAEIKRQATSELNLEIISKQEYFRKVERLGDDEAELKAKQMAKELKAERDFLNTVEEEPAPEGDIE